MNPPLTEVAEQGNFMVKLPPTKMDSRWQPQHLRALDVVIQ
ncbi:hypothetical protein [Candidatus Erwinia dacicola]|uniref:ABC-transporter, ATP-binding domain protein n=1 Tax=Candidatus Erwinia dacicola TaxID=252393 RepID=A0A328TM48_9GAMM|nr:hypothetical protein [Candidatus Erwinia dacicola]RAP71659.1 ABC-transporter, ATP-binding domain protein [Candidatus Erwinia dacicola]